jgi:hypothetical protein
MLFKVIFIFLAAMVLIALIGRALFPSALPRMLRKRAAPPVCAKCGRYLIGTKTCDCDSKAGGGRAK